MQLNAAYFISVAALHLVVFLSLRHVLLAARARALPLLALQVACAAYLGTQVFRVYEVLPALWWSDTEAHFRSAVNHALAASLVSLVVHLAWLLRMKRAAPKVDAAR